MSGVQQQSVFIAMSAIFGQAIGRFQFATQMLDLFRNVDHSQKLCIAMVITPKHGATAYTTPQTSELRLLVFNTEKTISAIPIWLMLLMLLNSVVQIFWPIIMLAKRPIE